MKESVLLVSIVISAIVLTPLFSAILRRRGAAKVPALLWLTLIAAAAVPFGVGWIILNPADPVSTATIERSAMAKAEKSDEDYAIRLNLPQNHSVMLTAILADDVDMSDPNAYKTDYSLKIEGYQDKQKWNKTITGVFEREAENKSDVEVESFQGKEISKMGDNGILLASMKISKIVMTCPSMATLKFQSKICPGWLWMGLSST